MSGPYIIERRFVGEFPIPLLEYLMSKEREWHKFRAYATERARQDAIERLARKQCNFSYEYRISESSEENVTRHR